VRLEAGESAPVALVLEPRDLQVWDAGVHAWAPVSGTFTVFVGASSRDVRLQGQFIQ
jgi:beta-glucosidase